MAFATGALLMALLLWPWLELTPRLFHTIEASLVDHHVQALAQGPVIQVASSDRHTVKPWFQGRIDYAPLVC